ncbi:cyclic nucleotide-binding domain-containing protein [Gorillibacterium sp. sgz5001074]|uniref:cyclic nucleotide-binding domain-containing protein n=1 Tax=Gorillibacterium sp. sgz5001074 TaxID=3446695 RepID=UPI003F672DAA
MNRVQDQEAIRRILRESGLEEVFRPEVAEGMELRTFTDGEKICTMGEVLDGLYVLASGKAKIYTLLPNGRSMLIRFSRPPSLIGDVEWMAQYPVNNMVEAVGECTLLFVSRELILGREQDHTAFLQFMIRNLSHKVYTLGSASAMNLLYPVENRFASYLLSVTEGPGGAEGAEELRTSTLLETAELLGTSYRHLNRVIRQLIAEGVLERKRGRLTVVDASRLRKLANNQMYT